jgi:hypothetical protein
MAEAGNSPCEFLRMKENEEKVEKDPTCDELFFSAFWPKKRGQLFD